jgi:hypothetical protein
LSKEYKFWVEFWKWQVNRLFFCLQRSHLIFMVHKWDKFFIMYKFIFTNKLISLYIRSNMKYYIINYSNCENNLVHGDKLDSQKWQIIRNGVTIFNIDFKDLYTRLYWRSKTTFFLLKRYLFWKRTKKIYFDYVYYSHNLFWLCVFWTCNLHYWWKQ